MKKILSTTILLIMMLSLANIASAAAYINRNITQNQQLKDDSGYDYSFLKTGEQGYYDNKTLTSVFILKDNNGENYPTYCANKGVRLDKAAKYSLTGIADTGYYTGEVSDKVRAILFNSYPYISIDELRKLTGISNLTISEAITGTQAAIWYYVSNVESTDIFANSRSVYEYFLSLKGEDAKRATASKIIIAQRSGQVSDDKYEIIFSLQADQKNADGSNVDLSYRFDKDIEGLYSACVTESVTEQGIKQVNVTGVPKQADFRIIVTANQILSEDAGFFEPEGGREQSQCLVGVINDTILVTASAKAQIASGGSTPIVIILITIGIIALLYCRFCFDKCRINRLRCD